MVAESFTSRRNESRSLLAVDIQGPQRGGFCIVPVSLLIGSEAFAYKSQGPGLDPVLRNLAYEKHSLGNLANAMNCLGANRMLGIHLCEKSCPALAQTVG